MSIVSKLPWPMPLGRPMLPLLLPWVALVWSLTGCPVDAQTNYAVPPADAAALRGIRFAGARAILPELTQRFAACDRQNAPGCKVDPSRNTAILQFPDGPVFFDAKMAIDADGSTLSKRAEFPNQPETALRYPTTGESLDSERVPYIVLPIGDLRRTAGVSTGDLAAVLKDGKLQFAIVGDVGPPPKIGEGSMKLHANLGHNTCTAFDAGGHCSEFTDVSIDPPVLYFVFPNTRRLIYDGLSPENINERIATAGREVWNIFLKQQSAPEQQSKTGN